MKKNLLLILAASAALLMSSCCNMFQPGYIEGEEQILVYPKQVAQPTYYK